MNKVLVQISGAFFLFIGVLGFFQNPLMGIFAVDTMHNIVHIVSGIAAIGFAITGEGGARTFGKVFTVVYGLVTVLGFIAPDMIRSMMTMNMADNYLHLVLTVLFAYIGFIGLPASKKATA